MFIMVFIIYGLSIFASYAPLIVDLIEAYSSINGELTSSTMPPVSHPPAAVSPRAPTATLRAPPTDTCRYRTCSSSAGEYLPGDETHIVVCGDVNAYTMGSFMSEFYHEDREEHGVQSQRRGER